MSCKNPKKMSTSTFQKLALLVALSFLNLLRVGAQQNKDSLAYYKLQLKQANEIPVDSVIALYTKAKQFADIPEVVVLARNEADYLTNQGLKDITYQKYERAIALAQDNELKVLEGLLYVDLSNYYYNFNKIKLAYKTILKAKIILENATPNEIALYNGINNSHITREEMLDPIIFNIGVMALDNKEYDKAELHYNESLSFSIKQNNKQGIVDAKINLANLLLEKGEFKKSNQALFKLLNDSIELNSDLVLVYYNISANYLELKEYQRALQYIDKTISTNDLLENDLMLVHLFFLKANIFKNLEKYKEAKQLLIKAKKILIFNDDLPFLLEVYKELAEIEVLNKNPKESNFYYKALLAIQDTIKKREGIGSYEEILLENKLYNQEQLNTNQQKSIVLAKKRGNLYLRLIIIGVVIFLILGLLFYLYRENNQKHTRLLQQKAKIKEIEFENKRELEIYETRIIQDDLKAKKRELLLALLFTKKRKEKLKQIRKKIDNLSENSVITREHLESIKKYITEKSDELDAEENVKQQIVNTHKDFFSSLLKKYPKLSSTELKILAYVRVDMKTKEIADIQNVSIDAVRKMRYRIRKKLELNPKQSLEKFILQYH